MADARSCALLILPPLLLGGCASGNGGNAAARDSWQNAPYAVVVERWGVPASTAPLADGRVAHTWVSQGTVSRSPVWPSIGVSAGSGMGVGIGVGVTAGASREVPALCERTLIFSDNRVAEQTWRGPADFCSLFRRP